MPDELTPFPDGIGYIEYAWDGLTPTQRVVLMEQAGYPSRRYGRPNSRTWAVLRSHGMVQDSPSVAVTERGQALADFAIHSQWWTTT